MSRKKLFSEMLKEAKPKSFNYIGTGNPEAKILVIGKECAIGEADLTIMSDYKSNLSQWERDLDKDLWDIPLRDPSNLSPVCPYKGQYMKLDNGRNWGTSKTWLVYQKLHNAIFGTSYERINFHKNFFTTELNDNPSPKAKDAIIENIDKRKDFIKNSEYFQSFPIVILAGLGYYEISEDQNDIENMFEVTFSEKRLAENKDSQPYWIHWNTDKSKLVINTRQLSMNISDQLLIEIASFIVSLKINLVEEEGDTNEQAKKRWEHGGKEIHAKYQELGTDFENSDEYKDYMTWVRTASIE